MYNVARIEQLLGSAKQVLAEQEAALLEKPDSFYRQMLVETSRAQVEEFTHQLIEEKNQRNIEVIEIRLIGEKAQHGSLPLHILSELTDSFEEMLVQAGQFLRYGTHNAQPPLQETRALMDVRLNRVSSGSTRLFVTAKSSPDMFGNSVSEDSLSGTLSLLNTETPTELNDRVAMVGKKTVKGTERFLKVLLESQLQAHVNWQTPLDKTVLWEGTLDKIGVLKHSLASISQNDPKEILFDGEILMESIRGQGKFEIRDYSSGKVFKGYAPKPVLPSLLALHVGEGCRGVLLETTIENQATREQKQVYELKSIEPAPVVRKAPSVTGSQMQLPF